MYQYKLTEKENFLRMFEGELPEYLPKYDYFGWSAGLPRREKRSADGYPVDEFGIEYTTSSASLGGLIPVPGRVLLHDITKWRDVVKTPDISDWDWEKYIPIGSKGYYVSDADTRTFSLMVGIGRGF